MTNVYKVASWPANLCIGYDRVDYRNSNIYAKKIAKSIHIDVELSKWILHSYAFEAFYM